MDRTNNLFERFNRTLKQGERRRSGRKTLAADFEYLPAEAALAHNLRRPDYVEILCGSLDLLAQAFAECDAKKRRSNQAAEPLQPHPRAAPPEIAGASLPRNDRRLVRDKAMGKRILAAARSRAPRVSLATAPCR